MPNAALNVRVKWAWSAKPASTAVSARGRASRSQPRVTSRRRITEYRYGLIRTTLSARPRRARVLLAKAAVLAGVTFTAGLAGTALAVPLWSRVVHGLGIHLFPATPGALLRAEVGTALDPDCFAALSTIVEKE